MEASQKQHGWLSPLLAIYTLFSPSMIEGETWGMGEGGMVLDAVTKRSITSSGFWAFESNTYLTLGGPPNSAQFIFPYSAPIPVTIVWLLGCLSTGFVLLVLKGKIPRNIGFLLLVALTLVPFFLPGLTENVVESFHTYRKSPLPIPQVVGITILLITRKLNLISQSQV
ncbi:MAG: hypothetical protein ACXAC0_02155 [Candidatus Thorarchaeota archaeon]|jgi:uncharacterized membrane protein YphA (DoxX/SURF4 family)